MTTLNEEVRKASLFTMNGLTDPRFVAERKPKEGAGESVRNAWPGKVYRNRLSNLFSFSTR